MSRVKGDTIRKSNQFQFRGRRIGKSGKMTPTKHVGLNINPGKDLFSTTVEVCQIFLGGDLRFLGETSFFWITGEVIQLGFLRSYPRILDHHVYLCQEKLG